MFPLNSIPTSNRMGNRDKLLSKVSCTGNREERRKCYHIVYMNGNKNRATVK